MVQGPAPEYINREPGRRTNVPEAASVTKFELVSGAVQAQLLTSAAMRAGFSGGLVVDFPHSTRAKKYFLVLMVGSSGELPSAQGLNGEASDDEGHVTVGARQAGGHNKRRKMSHHVGMVRLALCFGILPVDACCVV